MIHQLVMIRQLYKLQIAICVILLHDYGRNQILHGGFLSRQTDHRQSKHLLPEPLCLVPDEFQSQILSH